MTASPILQPQSSHTFSAMIRWHMVFVADQTEWIVGVGERVVTGMAACGAT